MKSMLAKISHVCLEHEALRDAITLAALTMTHSNIDTLNLKPPVTLGSYEHVPS